MFEVSAGILRSLPQSAQKSNTLQHQNTQDYTTNKICLLETNMNAGRLLQF